jgi:glutamyl-tRNA synthetase
MRVPRDEVVQYHDEIYGDLSFQGHTIDDQVLLKSDGFPTYHLAHVVDDHLMKTDMVIRGEEWLSSLPKHLLLFKWLGFEAPRYAHVPLLLNKDRSKLSKRQNDVAAEEYLQKGYLPEALLNFLVLLGWNPGTTQEMFTTTGLIEAFSLDRVQKSGAIFDTEKLNWLQGQWMRNIPLDDFVSRIQPLVVAQYPDAQNDPLFSVRAALIQERITFFSEAPEMLAYFYQEPNIDLSIVCSAKQKVTQEDLPAIVTLLRTTLNAIPEQEWSQTSIQAALEAAIPTSGFKKGQVLWPLRALLTGREYSPGAYEVAGLLTKEMVMRRMMVV